MKPGKSLPTSVDFHRLKYMEKVLFEDSENTSGPWTWLSGTLPLVVFWGCHIIRGYWKGIHSHIKMCLVLRFPLIALL